jgi:hypothetical protein
MFMVQRRGGVLQQGEEQRPLLPPFTEETARQKVRMAEDAWNTRDPEKVSKAYTVDSRWRNRDEFFEVREEIVDFLRRKWARELDYRLISPFASSTSPGTTRGSGGAAIPTTELQRICA